MTKDWVHDPQHRLIWHQPTGKCWALDLLLADPTTPIRQDGFTVAEAIDLITLLTRLQPPQSLDLTPQREPPLALCFQPQWEGPVANPD